MVAEVPIGMNVNVTSSFIDIDGNVFPLSLYFQNEVLNFDEVVNINGENIHFIINVNLRDKTYLFYYGKVVDGKDYELEFEEPITLSISDFYKSKSFNFDDIINYINNVSNKLDSFIQTTNDKFQDIYSFIDDASGEVIGTLSGKISNIKIDDIDFSEIENKLDDISSKVDVMNVFDISKMIDEKLGQLFNMPSLNGSNGSKYKDGEEVTVKGYEGIWKVEGSYPLLNNDSVTIVIYKLTQGDKVILAPSPFVGV